MNLISPSRLVLAGAGLNLSGDELAQFDGQCSFCGGPIIAGEPVSDTRKEMGPAFNNKQDLRIPRALKVCGACTTLRSTEWQQTYSKTLATMEGVFKLASNVHQAYFILNPPPPPFVAFVSDGKMQHLIWRSNVTYGTDLIYLRLGERQLSWSRKAVLRAFDAVKTLREAMEAASIKGSHPFVRIDRELGNAPGAEIRGDVRRFAAKDPGLQTCVDIIQELTLGELWALTILIFVDHEKIEPLVQHNLADRLAA